MYTQSSLLVRVPLPHALAVYGSGSPGSGNTLDHYEHLDWLGTSRLSSNQSRGVVTDVAYAPFGEIYASSPGNASSGISFTGQHSDVLTVSAATTNGLYDFPNREFPPTQGRWISPDPLGKGAAILTRPQTWNRYAYVSNNPLSLVDPLGLSGERPYCGTQGSRANCISLDSIGIGSSPVGDFFEPTDSSVLNDNNNNDLIDANGVDLSTLGGGTDQSIINQILGIPTADPIFQAALSFSGDAPLDPNAVFQEVGNMADAAEFMIVMGNPAATDTLGVMCLTTVGCTAGALTIGIINGDVNPLFEQHDDLGPPNSGHTDPLEYVTNGSQGGESAPINGGSAPPNPYTLPPIEEAK